MKEFAEKNAYYVPRVINPVKIKRILIFSANEEVQKAKKTLRSNLPWAEVQTFSDPGSVAECRMQEAAVLICDDTALNLLDTKSLRKHNPDLVVALLSSLESIQCAPTVVSVDRYPFTRRADLIFAVNRKECAPSRIVTAVVRSAEDHLNICKYSQARRYIILVVDDEPRWTTQFLPVLYDIIGQRAAVKVTRTYEETLRFLFGVEEEAEIDDHHYRSQGCGDDVVCLISDIFFPRGRESRSDSGTELVRVVDRYYPRFPKIIASKASQADDLKSTAFLMPKGDPGSLQTLQEFIQDFTGMGDFLVCSESGRELYRAKNLRDLLEIFKKAEKSTKRGEQLRHILEESGERDNFSTWLYMHGFKELANKILPMRAHGRRLVSLLKGLFEEEVARVDATPLVVHGKEIYSLPQLLDVIRTVPPAKLQDYSDNDVFSAWLDRKGYSELAEEIRPFHGSGQRLERTLAEKVEKWIKIYRDSQV
jgi:hypothetical protein